MVAIIYGLVGNIYASSCPELLLQMLVMTEIVSSSVYIGSKPSPSFHVVYNFALYRTSREVNIPCPWWFSRKS